eukprot:SAG22_NODE_4570_length_1231_cov_1.384276_1_plen_42_part_10
MFNIWAHWWDSWVYLAARQRSSKMEHAGGREIVRQKLLTATV